MESAALTEVQLRNVADLLSTWFDRAGRDFPWRFKEDGYLVLATEFLLQRTRASVANEAYGAFFKRYGTMSKLAGSDKKALERFFAPLGLGYRGARLQVIARDLKQTHSMKVPCDMNALLELHGVGVYIASAVMNFACRIPTPVVDKNVMRVLNRHFGITRESAGRELISNLYRYGDSRKIAYALIDLGALACLDSRCGCPLRQVLPVFPLRKGTWRMLRKVIREENQVRLVEQSVHNRYFSKG